MTSVGRNGPQGQQHAVGGRSADEVSVPLKEQETLLLFVVLLGLVGGGGGVDGLGFVGTGAGVVVAGLDVNVSVFAQLGEIGAQRRLQLFQVEGVLDFAFHILLRAHTRLLVLADLENHKALLGADGLGDIAGLHPEGDVFQFLGQGAALEIAQVAALGGGGPVRIVPGNVVEFGALLDLGVHLVGFGLGGGHALRVGNGGRGLGILGRLGLGGNQNFTQPHLLRLRHLAEVVFVVLLNLLRGDVDLGADFLLDDFLGDDVLAQVLLELFVGDALLLGGLGQVIHGGQVHLLADFVKPLHQVGFRGKAQVIALLQQKLLVNQVAQDVFLLAGDLLRRGALLLAFLLHLLLAAVELGAGDDVVVDAGNNLLHHRARLHIRLAGSIGGPQGARGNSGAREVISMGYDVL